MRGKEGEKRGKAQKAIDQDADAVKRHLAGNAVKCFI